jgi:hypothetical protein
MIDLTNIQTRLIGMIIDGMESSNDDDDKTLITHDKILIFFFDIKVGLESLSRSQVLALVEVLKQYGDVFAVDKNNPGSVDPSVASHSINTEDAKPVHQGPRKVSPAQRLIIKDTINALLKAGIIRPSRSPWSSPVLLVPKPGENNWRMCIDYKRLNAVTVKEIYAMPRIDDVLDSLEYSFMSFGLTNAPATFQRCNTVLVSLK